MDLATLAIRVRLRWLFVGMLVSAAMWGVLLYGGLALAQAVQPEPLTAVIYAVPVAQEPTQT